MRPHRACRKPDVRPNRPGETSPFPVARCGTTTRPAMPPATTASEIRQSFLDYFRRQGHEVVPSAPLLTANDPTLHFVNAGMVPFKDVFTGKDKRPYSRATSSQKCIRISGKHNDLENVGRTARHHTFFEMLGNFSFGDYFKEAAIAYAWELVTKDFGLPTDRLVITVFGGENGIPADDEARALWKKVTGFSDDRIIGMGMKDNFWQMGDTGPCGPCSELHYCIGDPIDVSKFGEEPEPTGKGWMEIWNLVFMQFDRTITNGVATLNPLPAPCVDTGAGLERIAAVMQGKSSNYDSDLLQALVQKASALCGKTYRGTMSDDDVSMRVIADHARLTAFLIAEGVVPDRDGRPYVLRRVMRRAIRHGHRLGIQNPFLHEVALEVVDRMSDVYGELRDRREMIAKVAEQEEVRFRETIERGLRMLDDEFVDLRKQDSRVLKGETAFKLYDTFGFPLDLTQVICDERMVQVDTEGYDKALEEARARSKGSDVGEKAVEQVHRHALEKVPGGKIRFVGYDNETWNDSTIVALVSGGVLVDTIEPGAEAEAVLDVTPFYGESGGQAGDTGWLKKDGVVIATVTDVQKPIDGLFAHKIKAGEKAIAVGDKVVAEIDHAGRTATRRNHSATHLLHYALRKVLGEHAHQKGSLVGPERLRFDFMQGKAVELEELQRIEDLVNEKVLINAPVETQVLPIAEAKKLGAMAIFGDKYGDVVRVLTMTPDSIELCGGTHARATGDIGLFKILSEGGISAGVRRIEAVTGTQAIGYVRQLEATLKRAQRLTKSEGGDLTERVEKLVQSQKDLEKQVSELTRKLAMGEGGGVDAMLGKARLIGGLKVLAVRAEVGDVGAIREMADTLRDKLGDSVVVIGANAGGKALLIATVAKSALSRIKAGDLIRPVAKVIGGAGGGKPEMAQAGGPDASKLDEALESVYAEAARLLGV